MKQIDTLLIDLFMDLLANAENSGTCGPNLRWLLTDNGVLVITGKGKMNDYSRSLWSKSDIKRIIIGDGVTTIEEFAFFNCSKLTSVTIPNSVTTIGSRAFFHCRSLKNFTFGSGLRSIGQEAFSDCINITQISSEAVVPPICDSGAFYGINKYKCKLIVPKNRLASYTWAYQWGDFLLIEG